MGRGIRSNPAHVVWETIDGETILIHLGTGTYYSIDGVGSEVWEAIASGTSVDTLLRAAGARYTGDPGEIELGLTSFLDQLLSEDLLVEDEASGDPCPLPVGDLPFSTPVLHIYTDMQEFMLVDPLHEVDEVAGWPQPKST